MWPQKFAEAVVPQPEGITNTTFIIIMMFFIIMFFIILILIMVIASSSLAKTKRVAIGVR
jgi:hypothetical protein